MAACCIVQRHAGFLQYDAGVAGIALRRGYALLNSKHNQVCAVQAGGESNVLTDQKFPRAGSGDSTFLFKLTQAMLTARSGGSVEHSQSPMITEERAMMGRLYTCRPLPDTGTHGRLLFPHRHYLGGCNSPFNQPTA